MPNCPSGCAGSLSFNSRVLTFSFLSLIPPATGDVRGFTATAPSEPMWTQPNMDRLMAKIQSFYDGLASDEQVVFEALLHQGAAEGVLR